MRDRTQPKRACANLLPEQWHCATPRIASSGFPARVPRGDPIRTRTRAIHSSSGIRAYDRRQYQRGCRRIGDITGSTIERAVPALAISASQIASTTSAGIGWTGKKYNQALSSQTGHERSQLSGVAGSHANRISLVEVLMRGTPRTRPVRQYRLGSRMTQRTGAWHQGAPLMDVQDPAKYGNCDLSSCIVAWCPSRHGLIGRHGA